MKPAAGLGAWVVMRLRHDGREWFPLLHTVRTRRAQAIRVVDETVGPGYYARQRRRGTMRAVRATVEVAR